MVSRAIGVHRQRWWILIISCTNYSFCVCVCVCVCVFVCFVCLFCCLVSLQVCFIFANSQTRMHVNTNTAVAMQLSDAYSCIYEQVSKPASNQLTSRARPSVVRICFFCASKLLCCLFASSSAEMRAVRDFAVPILGVNAIKGLASRCTFTVCVKY